MFEMALQSQTHWREREGVRQGSLSSVPSGRIPIKDNCVGFRIIMNPFCNEYRAKRSAEHLPDWATSQENSKESRRTNNSFLWDSYGFKYRSNILEGKCHVGFSTWIPIASVFDIELIYFINLQKWIGLRDSDFFHWEIDGGWVSSFLLPF